MLASISATSRSRPVIGGRVALRVELLTIIALKHNRLGRTQFGYHPERILSHTQWVDQARLPIVVEDEDGWRRNDAVLSGNTLLPIDADPHSYLTPRRCHCDHLVRHYRLGVSLATRSANH